MSGVWVFSDNGMIRLIDNPQKTTPGRRTMLVHLPTGEAVTSYSTLERILAGLGWEKYYHHHQGVGVELIQFHKSSSIDLISLPKDFSRFNSVYMYDLVIKNPNVFHVRDV